LLKKTENNKEYQKKLEKKLNNILPFNWLDEKFVLITAHRRENFGDGLFQICSAIKKLSFLHSNIHFVYPVHLNPNISKPVNKFLNGINNVHLIEPQEYEPFIYLLKHSYFVLTDSGGIQEEAPSLRKPVLVMRDVTERPEAIEAGTVTLVGSNYQKIINGVSRLIDNKSYHQSMSLAHNPYGDGLACDRIVDILRQI
jgi:UDP-N-acetylglucosamine 2-epimerase (non-hydrolysing)